MQVGSLVECIKTPSFTGWGTENIPTQGNIYTVRELTFYDKEPGIRLDEIVNPVLAYRGHIGECCFVVKLFRELQPPMTISIDEIVREGAPA